MQVFLRSVIIKSTALRLASTKFVKFDVRAKRIVFSTCGFGGHNLLKDWVK